MFYPHGIACLDGRLYAASANGDHDEVSVYAEADGSYLYSMALEAPDPKLKKPSFAGLVVVDQTLCHASYRYTYDDEFMPQAMTLRFFVA